MALVSVRFDARKLRNDLKNYYDVRIRSLTKDPGLYADIASTFVDTIREYLPIDTGALRYGITTTADRYRRRHGKINIRTTTSHDYGITFDPVEVYTPKTNRGHTHRTHYASSAIGRAYGTTNLNEIARTTGAWSDFASNTADLIVEKMSGGKK